MNQYREMRERQQKEFNDFTKGNMFFAFSLEQFAEGMKRLNLDPEPDPDKLTDETQEIDRRIFAKYTEPPKRPQAAEHPRRHRRRGLD